MIKQLSSGAKPSEVANIENTSFDNAYRKETYLYDSVPTTADNDWVDWVRAEPHTANPLGVSLIFNVVLALPKCVPQLDGLVSATRDNLSVVGGK